MDLFFGKLLFCGEYFPQDEFLKDFHPTHRGKDTDVAS
jgi:hypothetical protein